MTRRNERTRPIHLNMLHPSCRDIISLGIAVEERFLTLCESWLRMRGVQLPMPKSLTKDMFLWRTMMVRYKKGDFRHKEAEEKSLKAIAQYTVDRNNELRCQEPKTIKWERE